MQRLDPPRQSVHLLGREQSLLADAPQVPLDSVIGGRDLGDLERLAVRRRDLALGLAVNRGGRNRPPPDDAVGGLELGGAHGAVDDCGLGRRPTRRAVRGRRGRCPLRVVIIEKRARTLGLGVDGGRRERARASDAGGRDCVGRGPATEEGAEGRTGEEGQHRSDEVSDEVGRPFAECSGLSPSSASRSRAHEV